MSDRKAPDPVMAELLKDLTPEQIARMLDTEADRREWERALKEANESPLFIEAVQVLEKMNKVDAEKHAGIVSLLARARTTTQPSLRRPSSAETSAVRERQSADSASSDNATTTNGSSPWADMAPARVEQDAPLPSATMPEQTPVPELPRTPSTPSAGGWVGSGRSAHRTGRLPALDSASRPPSGDQRLRSRVLGGAIALLVVAGVGGGWAWSRSGQGVLRAPAMSVFSVAPNGALSVAPPEAAPLDPPVTSARISPSASSKPKPQPKTPSTSEPASPSRYGDVEF